MFKGDLRTKAGHKNKKNGSPPTGFEPFTLKPNHTKQFLKDVKYSNIHFTSFFTITNVKNK